MINTDKIKMINMHLPTLMLETLIDFLTYRCTSFVALAEIKTTLVIHRISNSRIYRNRTPIGRMRIVKKTIESAKSK